MKRTTIPVLALLLTGAGCARKTIHAGAPEKAPLPVVRVDEVAVVDRTLEIRSSGIVEAAYTAQVSFEAAGRVASVSVSEGDAVSAGRALAQLVAADYREAVNAAQGQTKQAQANLAKAQAGARRQERQQVLAATRQAEDEYRRMKFLFDRGSLPALDFRKVEAAWTAARERLDEVEEGVRREDREIARAALQQAQAQEQIARKRLSDTVLHAPISGYISRRSVEPGEMVSPGLPVFAIANIATVKVRAGVPEAEVGRVMRGQPVQVRIPAMPDLEWTGTVESAGIAADAESRTYIVKILVTNRDERLRPGMVAEIVIATSDRISAVTVPGEAIVADASGAPQVFVYEPSSRIAHVRRVRTGRPVGQRVEIQSGLKAGEKVVVAGQHKLFDGAAVESREAQQ
ncbi:MAG: efflux RND transporter periplasmic adaptor subunit [Bryobacterales bacterium]|nr:efflux RND transporter periplasmic adaptor subunit [Bryobacterales bacterium]